MPLSRGVERFLRRWERTKGFGKAWKLDGKRIRSNFSCPVSAVSNKDAGDYSADKVLLAAHLSADDADLIAWAADEHEALEGSDCPRIRRRLLKAVGLEDRNEA